MKNNFKIFMVIGISTTVFSLTALFSRYTVYYRITDTDKVSVSKESYEELLYKLSDNASLLLTTGVSPDYIIAICAGAIAMIVSALFFYKSSRVKSWFSKKKDHNR